jgi:hypothetical protein
MLASERSNYKVAARRNTQFELRKYCCGTILQGNC